MCRVILSVSLLHLIWIETDPLNVKLDGSPSYIFGCSSTVYRTGSRSSGSLTSITGGVVVVGVVAPGTVVGGAAVEAVVGHVTPPGHAEPETLKTHTYHSRIKTVKSLKFWDICYVTGYRYITHLYCLAVKVGFYSDAVQC